FCLVSSTPDVYTGRGPCGCAVTGCSRNSEFACHCHRTGSNRGLLSMVAFELVNHPTKTDDCGKKCSGPHIFLKKRVVKAVQDHRYSHNLRQTPEEFHRAAMSLQPILTFEKSNSGGAAPDGMERHAGYEPHCVDICGLDAIVILGGVMYTLRHSKA